MGQGSSWTRGEGELSEPETQGTSRLAGKCGRPEGRGCRDTGRLVECRPGQGLRRDESRLGLRFRGL